MRVHPEPLVVQGALEALVAEIVPATTTVQLDVPEDLVFDADPLVLDRVLSNVLSNAVRYGSPPFVVAATQRERHLRISVEDRGEGVPPELEARLFDRFERGEDAAGSGLGLAIARAYARAHGGDLVHERRDGRTRFELIVPSR